MIKIKQNLFFKPLFVSSFIIFALECIQLILDINYYPHINTRSESIALVALLFVVVIVALAVITKVLERIVRDSPGKESSLAALVEVVSTVALLFVYLPAVIFVLKKNYPASIKLFWLTGYGVFPILAVIAVIICRIFFGSIFKSIFYNIIDLFNKPAIVAVPLSIIYFVIFMLSNSTLPPSAGAPSKVSPSSGALVEKPNVILITFDALSANNMSLYGYERKTTPYWEVLAGESYVFDNMHSNFHGTQPSLVSIFTSKYPWTHGVLKWLDALKEKPHENIIAALGDEYKSAAVIPSMHHYPDFFGLRGVFDYNDWIGTAPPHVNAISRLLAKLSISRYSFPLYRHLLFLRTGYPIARWAEPFEGARKYMDKVKSQPYFLWVHLWPPHVQNHPPPPYLGTFLSADKEVEILSGTYTEAEQEGVDNMRARYDEVVLFTDDALKDFIKSLKESGEFDKSIIIVSADHGETFEGGYVTMGPPLMFESQFHVPLLIHLPGQRQGARIKALAEQIDLGPTILDLLGKQIPVWMEGESLMPYMLSPTLESERTKYSMLCSFEEVDEGGARCLYAAYWKDYKLVYHMHMDAAMLFKVVGNHQVKFTLNATDRAVLERLRYDLDAKISENYAKISRTK